MSQQATDELSTEIGPTRLENTALQCAIDAESELRGYQVTGDPRHARLLAVPGAAGATRHAA